MALPFDIKSEYRYFGKKFGNSGARPRNSFQPYFPGIPVILMEQDSSGNPKYHGHKNIVNFLVNIHPSRIPWKTYTVS